MKLQHDLEVSGAIIPRAYSTTDLGNITLPTSAVVWNSDNDRHEYFNGSFWVPIETQSWVKRISDPSVDHALNLNVVNTTGFGNFVFTGVSETDDTGLMRSVSSASIRTYYTGHVRGSYHFPMVSTSATASIRTAIVRRRGGIDAYFLLNYSLMVPTDTDYICSASGSGIIDCEPNDVFWLTYYRNGSDTTAVFAIDFVTFELEKV